MESLNAIMIRLLWFLSVVGAVESTTSFSPASRAELNTAVDLWDSDQATALSTYGHISGWDTSGIIDMQELFRDMVSFNDDISLWDTSRVFSMQSMFRGASAFNQDISAWDTSTVTSMTQMFFGASAFNQNISAWDTARVTSMSEMFRDASAFNQNISAWDTSSVIWISGMFNGASVFNQDISAWDTSRVVTMFMMFTDASAFNQDISAWNTSRVTDMYYMFKGASVFNHDISLWDTSRVFSMHSLFRGVQFYFLLAEKIRGCTDGFKMPRMQELPPDWMVSKGMEFLRGYRGDYRKTFCTVSHRWETQSQPDSLGMQLLAIRDFLQKNPQIQYVWYDFWCMPQKTEEGGKEKDDRSEKQKGEFKRMLKEVNLLYLSTQVLILMDVSYTSRFWTSFEAYLSMQVASEEGLKYATGEEDRRFTITCMHTATHHSVSELRQMWSHKTPQEAHETLSKPDITVTNARDKEEQLEKLLHLNEEVRRRLVRRQQTQLPEPRALAPCPQQIPPPQSEGRGDPQSAAAEQQQQPLLQPLQHGSQLEQSPSESLPQPALQASAPQQPQTESPKSPDPEVEDGTPAEMEQSTPGEAAPSNDDSQQPSCSVQPSQHVELEQPGAVAEAVKLNAAAAPPPQPTEEPVRPARRLRLH